VEFSAGGVVVRDGEVVVIVPVKRAADGSRVLGLPKGHVDPGETELEAAARRVGTIATICASSTPSPARTTTPPAEISRAGAPRPRLEDILLQRLRVVHDQAPPSLGDHPRALEHGQKAAGGLA
jgi:hypothetical protein